MSVQTHHGLESLLERLASLQKAPDGATAAFYALGCHLGSHVGLVLIHELVPVAATIPRTRALVADAFEDIMSTNRLDELAGTTDHPALSPVSGDNTVLREVPLPFEFCSHLLRSYVGSWSAALLAGQAAGVRRVRLNSADGYTAVLGLVPSEWLGYDVALASFIRGAQTLGATQETSEDDPTIGWGVYLEPRVVFVADNDAHRALAARRTSKAPSSVILEHVVDEIELKLCDDGLAFALTRSQPKAYRALAFFCAILPFVGVKQIVPRPTELVAITKLNQVGYPDHWATLSSLNRTSKYALGTTLLREPYLVAGIQVAREALTFLSAHLSDAIADRTIHFCQADALFHQGYWTESFLVSWMLIEQSIKAQCLEMFAEKGYSKTSIEKRIGSGDWGVSQHTDALFAAGKIDISRAGELHSLRQKRNDIVHRVQSASQEDARRCLGTARSLLVLPSAPQPRVLTVFPT